MVDIESFRKGMHDRLQKVAAIGAAPAPQPSPIPNVGGAIKPPTTAPLLPAAKPTASWLHPIDRMRQEASFGAVDGINKAVGQATATPEARESLYQKVLAPEDYQRLQKARGTADQVGQFTDAQGKFDMNKTMGQAQNWFSSNIANPLKQQFGNIQQGNWQQAGDWVKQNPWLTAGVAATTAAGLYGGSKLIGGMFGGGSPQPQYSAPRPYQAPPAYTTPQALQKAGGASAQLFNAMTQQGLPDVRQHLLPHSNKPSTTGGMLHMPEYRQHLINLVRNANQERSADTPGAL